MLSTALEVAGFGCAVAGALIMWGAAPALFVAAPCLLFMGYAAEGAKVKLPMFRLPRRKAKA